MSSEGDARTTTGVPPTRSTLVARLVLAAMAVPAGLYAAWLLLEAGSGNWLNLAIWLGGGVLIHDGVIAPVTVALGLAAMAVLPAPWRAPAVVGLVCWGSITLFAIPVLGRFGALPDNPTLLDRPYAWSWLVLSILTVVLVGLAGLVRSRRG